MNDTLNHEPARSVVDALFREADASDQRIRAQLAALPDDERAALFAGSDYRVLYERTREEFLAVSRETGALLYLLARAACARSVVELGTSFGVSTIHLAAAVRDNGGGRVVGTELFADKAARARKNLADAGLAEGVEVREGDALVTLREALPDRIDFVLLDGAKQLYAPVLALLEPNLAPGALIVADNADRAPDYRARVQGNGYRSMAFREDVEVSVRL